MAGKKKKEEKPVLESKTIVTDEIVFRKSVAPLAPESIIQDFKKKAALFGLDPMNNEIGLYLGEDGVWFTLIRRDGFRRILMDNPAYDYHYVIPEYLGDRFKIVNSVLEFDNSDRDKAITLIGAWGIIKMKEKSVPQYFHASLHDYVKPETKWTSIPEIMITKVAETGVIKLALGPVFSNVYDETEIKENVKIGTSKKDDLLAFIRENIDIASSFIGEIGISDMTMPELHALEKSIKEVLERESHEEN